MANTFTPSVSTKVVTYTGNGFNSLLTSEATLAVRASLPRRPDLARAISRYRRKYRPALSRAIVKGDSYGAGAGATGSLGYAQQLATAFAQQFGWSNYSYAGRPISAYRFAPYLSGANIGATMGLVQSLADDLCVGILGLNDLRGVSSTGATNSACGALPSSKYTLISRLQADVTWNLIPETSRVRMHTLNNSGPNPAVTFTGTWNHAGINSNLNSSFSSTVGNTASLTTAVGDLLVIRYLSNYTSTGTFTVTIDNVIYGPFSNKAAYDGWVTDCIILQVSTVAAHSVVLTHVSGDNLIVDSVDCVDTSTDFGGVYLYSGPAPLSPTGWAIAPTMNSARANSYAVATTDASVTGTTLSINTVTTGQFSPGQMLVAQTGTGVLAAGTVIVEQITKTGGSGQGTYLITPAATSNGTITSLTVANPTIAYELEHAGRDRFASWVDEAMQNLFNLGFNTVRVDAMRGYDPRQFEATGNEVHPKDLGHAWLFNAFRADITAILA